MSFLMLVLTILLNSLAILTERMPLKFSFNSIFHFFLSTLIKYERLHFTHSTFSSSFFFRLFFGRKESTNLSHFVLIRFQLRYILN